MKKSSESLPSPANKNCKKKTYFVYKKNYKENI